MEISQSLTENEFLEMSCLLFYDFEKMHESKYTSSSSRAKPWTIEYCVSHNLEIKQD